MYTHFVDLRNKVKFIIKEIKDRDVLNKQFKG